MADIEITGDMTGVTGDLTGCSGDFTDCQGDFTDVNGDVTDVSGDVSAIEGDVTDVAGDVANAEVGNFVEPAVAYQAANDAIVADFPEEAEVGDVDDGGGLGYISPLN